MNNPALFQILIILAELARQNGSFVSQEQADDVAELLRAWQRQV